MFIVIIRSCWTKLVRLRWIPGNMVWCSRLCSPNIAEDILVNMLAARGCSAHLRIWTEDSTGFWPAGNHPEREGSIAAMRMMLNPIAILHGATIPALSNRITGYELSRIHEKNSCWSAWRSMSFKLYPVNWIKQTGSCTSWRCCRQPFMRNLCATSRNGTAWSEFEFQHWRVIDRSAEQKAGSLR